jgi:hypothetical protein
VVIPANDTEYELVFKHGIYMVNQFKISYNNEPITFPTLLHKFIKIKKENSLEAMDKG